MFSLNVEPGPAFRLLAPPTIAPLAALASCLPDIDQIPPLLSVVSVTLFLTNFAQLNFQSASAIRHSLTV